MASVFHCSPTNSTHFTTCCQVAITDSEQRCPRCREDVYPFHKDMTEREREEAAGGYCHHIARMARDSACRRLERR